MHVGLWLSLSSHFDLYCFISCGVTYLLSMSHSFDTGLMAILEHYSMQGHDIATG